MVMTQLALSVNRRVLAIAIGAWLAMVSARSLALSPADAPSGVYIYQVSRNGQVIGQLRQDFDRQENRLSVVTSADVEVTILGLSIYEADQRVEEIWQDGKLQSIISSANVDGDGREVMLQRKGNRLIGIYNGKERNLSGALVPTTLWNSSIVKAKAVLDTGKGKIRKITVTDMGHEQIQVSGRTVNARHYSLAGEFRRELWYDESNVLVAVEMQGKDGSTIRQELLARP